MQGAFQPFLGDFSRYGEGPEHRFFLDGLLTGSNLVGGSGSGDTPLPAPDPGGNRGPSGGDGPGIGGGGAQLGTTEDKSMVGPDFSETTTDDPAEFGISLLGLTNPAMATVATLANIAQNKNDEPSKMGWRGAIESLFGLDKSVNPADLENAMNNPAFGGGTVDDGPTPGEVEDAMNNPAFGGGEDPSFSGGNPDTGDVAGDNSSNPGDVGDAGQYAGGGFIPGDMPGMDDTVPAAIDGFEPAALSSGEFVLPADIVAAIGDGNTAAGAKKLDKFMTTVRQQKYGRDRQPPKFRPKTLANLLGS